MQKKLSIVIPTFNSRDYVLECVASSLNQTYPNLEVVIDDNTSRDGTPDLIKAKFGNDPRLKVFANREDLNIPHGWNRGVDHSTGDFFLLLHSDNLLHPRYAETVMGLLNESNADVAYSESLYFEGETPPDLFSDFSPKEVRHAVMTGGPRTVDYVFRFQRMIPTSSLVIRKDCLKDRKAYDPNFRWDPDIELMTFLASHFRIAHVDFPLAAIRTHDGQAPGWKDPTFSRQYRSLLKMTNETSRSEPYSFLLHWAGSNQDICEKLSGVKGAPAKIYFQFWSRWISAELRVLGHFCRYFLSKSKRMSRALVRFLVTRLTPTRV